jgi:hypothetical protein
MCDCSGFQAVAIYEQGRQAYPSPDMLAAVQTGHKIRASCIIPLYAGHMCFLALSEAAHGTFGNTQY